jgi:hypothetical protein
MTLLAFLGALSLSVIVFEIATAMQDSWSTFSKGRSLAGMQISGNPPVKRRSTWEALLLVVFPYRFDPAQARDLADVVSLLRRAGYPYDTPGDFYAASIRTFSAFLLLSGLSAGALVFLGMPVVAPVVGAILVFLGLRHPYSRLKILAKRRAEAMHNNMLTGLSVMNALLSSGVSVQEALRQTAGVGGPFCNLLGLLVARMEVEDFSKAIEVTRAHLPDPADVEANLFLRDIHDFFVYNRPILASVQALQEAVHRSVVEATEARAALVRQRSGLVGILAVVGLVFSIIGPFLGAF